ncbi:hypothetical protein IXO92_16795, partial [Xanthomonas oryzae pv. oryzae]
MAASVYQITTRSFSGRTMDFSPEQIAGRTGLASHACIYRHIDADQKRGGQLFMHLRKRRRKRRRRGVRDGRGQLTHRRRV